MPNKTEEYLALACKTADSFSRQWEHWAEFLITAARLYKYSYPDQLMIYAQRPDATACAEYDVWNNKMNRYVRRGSKGIALLDESGGYPRLHYVFDVSDTAPRRNALYPDLWQINESTIISSRKPSTRCGPAALWHLSPAVIRWTVRILLPGSILRSVRICWEQSDCQTTHFAPMRAPMLSVTSSFCRNATGPWTMNPLGYSWERRKMESPSTATLRTTRR